MLNRVEHEKSFITSGPEVLPLIPLGLRECAVYELLTNEPQKENFVEQFVIFNKMSPKMMAFIAQYMHILQQFNNKREGRIAFYKCFCLHVLTTDRTMNILILFNIDGALALQHTPYISCTASNVHFLYNRKTQNIDFLVLTIRK